MSLAAMCTYQSRLRTQSSALSVTERDQLSPSHHSVLTSYSCYLRWRTIHLPCRLHQSDNRLLEVFAWIYWLHTKCQTRIQTTTDHDSISSMLMSQSELYSDSVRNPVSITSHAIRRQSNDKNKNKELMSSQAQRILLRIQYRILTVCINSAVCKDEIKHN